MEEVAAAPLFRSIDVKNSETLISGLLFPLEYLIYRQCQRFPLYLLLPSISHITERYPFGYVGTSKEALGQGWHWGLDKKKPCPNWQGPIFAEVTIPKELHRGERCIVIVSRMKMWASCALNAESHLYLVPT